MLERILLVEDDAGEALFVKKMLRDAGLDDPVYHISDSEGAMAYLLGQEKYSDRKQFPMPEVILLDLKMPNVDGYQFLRWLRAERGLSGIFVVVLTAEMNPKMIQLAYQLGANSFLSKNGNAEEFKNFVAFVRGYSRIAHAAPHPKPTSQANERQDGLAA